MSESAKAKKPASIDNSESLPDSIKRTQVDDKPKRRVFDPEYKLSILEQIEECRGKRVAVGELLRKERLYAGQVAKWKEEAKEALTGALSKKLGPKPKLEAKAEKRIAQLERDCTALQEKLRQAEVIIEVQKNSRDLGDQAASGSGLEKPQIMKDAFWK
jgi:transposase-like protein